MWAYNFVKKETRLQVPTWWTFLKQNHDLLKLWCEEEQEAYEDRTNFLLRSIRFINYLLLLFLIICALINPQESFYAEECLKR